MRLLESSSISPSVRDALAIIHRQTLELIVQGASLETILDALDPDLISSVLLADSMASAVRGSVRHSGVSEGARDQSGRTRNENVALRREAPPALGRQDEFGPSLAKLAGASGWEPTFVFRLGYAVREAPRSPRRPLADVVTRASLITPPFGTINGPH